MEECYFFNNSGYKLFGHLFRSHNTGEERDLGIILCDAFAEEKLWSQRIMVSFARFLASHGFNVLHFDFMGHGDSEGEFESINVETLQNDITAAVNNMRSKTSIKETGLLGLRLGATIAALWAEKNRKELESLMLWEPVSSVEKYLNQALRSNMTTQMATYKKIVYNRDQMIKDLKAGKSVNIDGYLMSSGFYKRAITINMGEINPGFSGKVLISNIVKNEKSRVSNDITSIYDRYSLKNQNTEMHIIPELPFWSDTKLYYQHSESLFQKTLEWLEK